MLSNQEVHLAAADTMLPGAGAAERDCPMDKPIVQFVRPVHFIFIVRVDKNDEMEIAVTDVPDDRCEKAALVDVASGFQQTFRQFRDRNAGVGRDALLAGRKGQRRIVGVVPGLPEFISFFFGRRPGEGAAAEIVGNAANRLRLFLCGGSRKKRYRLPSAFRQAVRSVRLECHTGSSVSPC